MISNVKAARARYFGEIEQKKKKSKKSTPPGKIKDTDKLAFEAEAKNDLKLLGRSNDLRKISQTKKKS